jgi:hypothetical protein
MGQNATCLLTAERLTGAKIAHVHVAKTNNTGIWNAGRQKRLAVLNVEKLHAV